MFNLGKISTAISMTSVLLVISSCKKETLEHPNTFTLKDNKLKIELEDANVLGSPQGFECVEFNSSKKQFFVKPGAKIAKFGLKTENSLSSQVTLFMDKPFGKLSSEKPIMHIDKQGKITKCSVSYLQRSR